MANILSFLLHYFLNFTSFLLAFDDDFCAQIPGVLFAGYVMFSPGLNPVSVFVQ